MPVFMAVKLSSDEQEVAEKVISSLSMKVMYIRCQ
jgi:hypothetical protein